MNLAKKNYKSYLIQAKFINIIKAFSIKTEPIITNKDFEELRFYGRDLISRLSVFRLIACW